MVKVLDMPEVEVGGTGVATEANTLLLKEGSIKRFGESSVA